MNDINEVLLTICILLSGILIFICGRKSVKERNADIKESCNRSCRYISRRDIIYVSIIATVLLVIFGTEALYKDAAFGAQLSFAGTISSIILSVLAIFMTLIGEQKQEGTKNAIEKATQEITSAAENLKMYSQKIDVKSMEEILNSTKQLETQLKSAIESLEEQRHSLSKLEATVTEQSYGPGEDINTHNRVNRRTNALQWENKKGE